MPTQPQAVAAPETYRRYEDKLNPGNHLFVCGNCGHKSGDPRPRNFYGKCAGCERIVRQFRIIE